MDVMTSQPSELNLDVLGTICAFLTEYPDLLAISLTCSALHPVAIRNMLKNRPVVLKRADVILKFHDFVFSDAPTRLHHLTALEIGVTDDETRPECSERAIDSLLAILKSAPSLVSLALRSSAWDLSLGYIDDPRIPAAVGELANLRVLTIIGRTEVVDFIGAVRSPLTKLAISYMDPAGRTEWSLTSSLSHVAASLESLTIDYSDVRLVGRPPDSLSRLTQFCALRSLTLSSLVGVPRLLVLLELFPNLNGTLHLVRYPDRYEDEELQTYNSFKETREQNATAQERQSWKRLERLICNAEMLFALNLRSQIGLTVIHSCSTDTTVRKCLVESLREHPPARLNLQVPLSRGLEAPFSGMIPPEAAATLTHLTLCIVYRYNIQYPTSVPPMEWDVLWRDTLLLALQNLPCLTHLRFVFHCETWKDEEVMSEDPFLNDLRPASFDFVAVASAIVDVIPSLRYCFLTTSAWVAHMIGFATFSIAERWCESHAWRIATNGDTEAASGASRELVELHNGVAETIIQNEDLILSKGEEASVLSNDVVFLKLGLH
ncbi:hypothetical protein LXA43DRAFT_1008695 [Ganoderma leucocontextum]|nr:hypothetical protein LXA43DRAFT_1008695 [Ganoderma leucocontextum]